MWDGHTSAYSSNLTDEAKQYMRILYFNYSSNNLATMIRCLEIARAVSLHGHDVKLCFMNPAFSPPAFFLDLLSKFSNDHLEYHIHRAIDDITSVAVVQAAKATPKLTPTPKQKVHKRRFLSVAKQALLSLRYIPAELKHIRKYKPDVIIARPDQIFSFVISSFFSGKPLVINTDGPVEELSSLYGIHSKFPVLMDTFRLKRAQAILYVSEVCGDLIRKKGIPEEKLFSCPNGADPEFFKAQSKEDTNQLKQQLGLGDSYVIGFSGNLVAYHGVDQLIQACLPIMEKNPSVKLMIIGTLKAEDSLGLNEIPEEIRKNRLIFTGMLPYVDMPKYIDCADVMVMPYPPMELFFFSPMKMFEGLSMGKILIASDQGQVGEFLEGLSSAYLYDAESKGSLALMIERAMEALKSGLDGKPSRTLALEKHTWFERGRVTVKACEAALMQNK